MTVSFLRDRPRNRSRAVSGAISNYSRDTRYNGSHVRSKSMPNPIGILAWIDFAFKKIFGKPGNEVCLISFLNAVLDLPHPVESVEFLNPFSLKEFKEAKLICVDVKATDSEKRVFIVEVQMVVTPSFAKRAVYYAAKAYFDQLAVGQGYGKLKATYAICLLMRPLWADSKLHHHFRLVEKESGVVLDDAIEIHTLELSKYEKPATDLSEASALEQWCYWIKYSHEHTEDELRALLPGLAFLHATQELKEIQEVTEERQMYDSREKAVRDLESGLIDAREEGFQIGIEKGIEKGEIRLIQTLQEILGEHVSEETELRVYSMEQLQALAADLRNRILHRS
jgi:predicted transposase/invertase (TIGR01784 family)